MNQTVVDIKRRVVYATPLYQWDYGQVLIPTGVDLPEVYEVHFKVKDSATTMTILGNSDGVLIPDELLTEAIPITCYIYLHTGADDGETEYKITIPVLARPEPSDYEPTPVQQDVITQTIAALNAAQYEWEHMSATAVTLDPEEPATASYADGVLTLGIPKGEKGDDGGGAVESVNGKTGVVVLDASDVGALATETDPTVPAWAKQANKPTYTASEVGALPDTTVIPTVPTNVSAFINDAGYLTSAVTSFNGNTGAVTYTAPVTSVNGQTGAVTIANATTTSAGLMSAQDKTDLGTLMADYSSALTALGVI